MEDEVISEAEYRLARKRLNWLHDKYGFMRIDGMSSRDIPVSVHEERRNLSKVVEKYAWTRWHSIPSHEREVLHKMVDAAKKKVREG